MPFQNLPIVCPTPGARSFDSPNPYHTANGFLFSVQRRNFETGAEFPGQALAWIEAALNACSFDVERLWAVNALWEYDVFGSGSQHEIALHFIPAHKEDIPNFPNDFVHVSPGQAIGAGFVDIYIWEGLAAAPPPFGGRLFFQETVIHALGHIVGGLLAVGDDLYKRRRVADALMWDVIRGRAGRYGEGWGTGAAWQLWDQLANDPDWRMRPYERYAEAFKDIYMDPKQRRFVNRTRTPFIDVAAIRNETHGFLPINYIDLPPHPGQYYFQGFQFSAIETPAKSMSSGCVNRADGGLGFVCYDPDTDKLRQCVPCDPGVPYDPRDPKLCSQFWSFPQTPKVKVQWAVNMRVPKMKFCEGARIYFGAAPQLAGFTYRGVEEYQCPGPRKKRPGGIGRLNEWSDGAYVEVVWSIGEKLTGTAVWRDRFNRLIRDPETQATVEGHNGQVQVHGITDFHVDVTLGIDYSSGGPSSTSFFASMFGYFDNWFGSNAEMFNFAASQPNIDAGYAYAPGVNSWFYAPSEGGLTDPYSLLNLEGVDRGTAKIPTAVGSESAVQDLTTRLMTDTPQTFSGSSLTIGGT